MGDRCDVLGSLLTAYVDDELTEAERALVETHLGECDACMEQLKQLHFVVDTLSELPAVPMPSHFIQAVRERVETAPSWADAVVAALGGRRFVPAASMVCAFVLFGLYTRAMFESPFTPMMRVPVAVPTVRSLPTGSVASRAVMTPELVVPAAPAPSLETVVTPSVPAVVAREGFTQLARLASTYDSSERDDVNQEPPAVPQPEPVRAGGAFVRELFGAARVEVCAALVPGAPHPGDAIACHSSILLEIANERAFYRSLKAGLPAISDTKLERLFYVEQGDGQVILGCSQSLVAGFAGLRDSLAALAAVEGVLAISHDEIEGDSGRIRVIVRPRES